MYEVDEKDRIVSLDTLPQSSVGAPIPVILGVEFVVVVAYYVQESVPPWRGPEIRLAQPSPGDEKVGIVRFNGAIAHMFGPPNDEAFEGHPLAGRGLRPYSAFEVKYSSWIRRLERMNSVHEAHNPETFWSK